MISKYFNIQILLCDNSIIKLAADLGC